MEVNSQRQAESILKMKTFHTTKCKAYCHEKLNTLKDSHQKLGAGFGYSRGDNSNSGKTRSHRHQKNLYQKRWRYILTFNQPHIPPKIGYYLVRVEQYIPAPLKCFKCQKYDHLWEGVKDNRLVQSLAKRTWTRRREVSQIKFSVQIANKTIWLSQVKETRKY